MVGHACDVVDQFAAAVDDADAVTKKLASDVGRLRPGQCLHAIVNLRQRDLGVLDGDVESKPVGPTQFGSDTGRRDEGLGRNAVEQHAGTADAVGVDDRDLCDVRATTRRDQRSLVTCRAATDDDDARNHGNNLAVGFVPRRFTRLRRPTQPVGCPSGTIPGSLRSCAPQNVANL